MSLELPEMTVTSTETPEEIPENVIKFIEEKIPVFAQSTSTWGTLVFTDEEEEPDKKAAATFERLARAYCKTRAAGALTFRRQAVDEEQENVSADSDQAAEYIVKFRVVAKKK